MNKDKIKQELKQEIKILIDYLDYNTPSNYTTMKKNHMLIELIKEKLLYCQYCQKPKVKTLEQKLIDAGFNNKYLGGSGYSCYYNKICLVLIGYEEKTAKISYCLDSEENGICFIVNKINDHDQIFADIAYLESRINNE
jgi:hypothetical protein